MFFMLVTIPWNKIRVQLRKKVKADIGKYLTDSAIPKKITSFTANFKMQDENVNIMVIPN